MFGNFFTGTVTQSYSYIAFDHESGAIIASGKKAISALQIVDVLRPGKAIEILEAGLIGDYMWNYEISLWKAQLLVGPSTTSDSNS